MAFSKYLNFTIPLLKNFINGCKSACFVSCLSCWFFLLARFLRDVVSSFLSLLYIHLLLTLSLLSLSLYVWFFKVNSLSRFDLNFLFQQVKITKKIRVIFSFCSKKTRTLFKFPFLIERSKWNCVLNSTVLPWKNKLHTKGQLISEANFKVYIWTKNQTRIFL